MNCITENWVNHKYQRKLNWIYNVVPKRNSKKSVQRIFCTVASFFCRVLTYRVFQREPSHSKKAYLSTYESDLNKKIYRCKGKLLYFLAISFKGNQHDVVDTYIGNRQNCAISRSSGSSGQYWNSPNMLVRNDFGRRFSTKHSSLCLSTRSFPLHHLPTAIYEPYNSYETVVRNEFKFSLGTSCNVDYIDVPCTLKVAS